MKVFLAGASGYIGGSVAAALIAAGHSVTGLVRTDANAKKVEAFGVTPVIGAFDDSDVLAKAASAADAVINAANADHEPGVRALMGALIGTGKAYIHTSGSSIVGTQAGGKLVDAIYDETTPLTPSPGRAARVALNQAILAEADKGFRPVVICPSLIYGLGAGATLHSMQVPWLIATARKKGIAKHFGPGENIWSNVHISDLAPLYLAALDAAPAGAFYFAENGENSMRELCVAISNMLGFGGRTEAMTLGEAAEEWGEGAALNTMGSNSRVRAVRAREELNWRPGAPSLITEIEHGCYAV